MIELVFSLLFKAFRACSRSGIDSQGKEAGEAVNEAQA